ncbi:hypothetical protein GCM10007063_19880 [Lentibacillus kapialis]|uniref:Uncharacterized protein n=1 Tax=Lentibacillus kapialis TaxID=340214 RepID=A0A917PX13_9BACI|nr:hypothetical protein [Lentibacillus kapialis]GGJ97579.1 hypothetical protein GCM10007063_19880 [Lentibacillus kapialis]
MRKQLFWILPSIIIITGIFLMFNQSITDVTEQPEANWSRGLEIGTTTVDKTFPVQETPGGNFIIQTYEQDKLRAQIFNHEFKQINEKTYDIPLDKWTRVFLNHDQLIYHDYNDIYDQDGDVIVSNAKRFYPLGSTILYIKENNLYELNPDDLSSTKIVELNKGMEDIIPFQGKKQLYFMTEQSLNNDVKLNIYELTDNGAKRVYSTSFQIDAMQTVEDTDFAVRDSNLAFMLETVQKQSQGSPESYTYVAKTSIGSNREPSLKPLTFPDPAGEGSLSEPNDITISYQNETLQLLFSANGFTETTYQENQAFNVYTATITDNGEIQSARKSNTAKGTVDPKRLNNSTVMWLEQGSERNNILISSSNPAVIDKASTLSQDDWLRALGKTFGMLAKVLITILATTIWFIWPVVFVVLMYVVKGRKLDEDISWFFYTGIVIYMLATFIFHDIIFIDGMFARAPDYLTFTGSSYIYTLFFALIAFIATQSTKATHDWHAPARIIYFAGAHILMLVAYFGPYYF